MDSTFAATAADQIRTEPVPMTVPTDPALPVNAFTIDVEDWYQSCWDYDAPITERVVRNVHRILQILADTSVRGTFFVQGRVAERFPGLIEEIASQGNEVQSHGYSHRPLFRMSPSELRDELERSKKSVEDAAGVEVTAFRAQDFSIGEHNLWALGTLADVGFRIDSSVFPMRSRRYGVLGWPLAPHRIVIGGDVRLLEVPVAVWSRGRIRFPVAGGGYFRVLPRAAIERGIESIVASGRPAIVYCHPYEFAPRELAGYTAVPRKVRISQGFGRARFARRMEQMLGRGSFGRMADALKAWGVS